MLPALQLEADLAKVGGDPSLLTSDAVAKTLTLYHLQGVFMVYGVCIVVACLVYILEFAVAISRKTRSKTPSNNEH